jgi:DNA gyrase subunit A
LLIAILDIDEVIQVIRTSDDSDGARTRLMEVFDLSQVQAEYILELRLRRLTRFSRIELENERDQLHREIEELEAILSDPARIRGVVSDELEATAERFGTPRRTLLTEARPSIATTTSRSAKAPAPDLEIADAPCRIFLSTTGRIIRVDLPSDGTELPAAKRRSKHDAIRSTVDATSRSEIGAVTSLGRLLRFTAVDLPSVPANSIQLAAGARVADYLAMGNKKERVLGLVSLDSELAIALGTAQGVVKRVAPGLPAKPELEIIALKAGDEVVGVVQAPDNADLTFITTDAQLLHFPASAVRPQGAAAGGMAGMNLSAKATALFFGAVDPAAPVVVVVTVSGSGAVLPGTDPGRGKVSELSEFPGKGRATGGVRAHSFLKGEDTLTVAWAGAAPAVAVGADGSARTLPDSGAKRDASGTPLDAVVGSIGTAL